MRASFLCLVLTIACAADPDGPTKTPGDGPVGGDAATAGDETPPGDPTVDTVAAEDMCTWITEVFCQAEQQCCTDGAHKYGSYEQCVASEGPDCESSLTPIFVDTRTGYDADIAGERITELRIMADNCDPLVGAWSISREDGLYGVMLGTVGLDGDCSPASLGDLAVAAICTEPNVCQLTWLGTFTGVCEAASGSGGGCYTDLECSTDLHCDPEENWLGGGGSCTARLADGFSCDVDGACLSLYCDAGGHCAPPTANSAYCLNE